METTQTIRWSPFSVKHQRYIKRALSCRMNVAEGAIRSGKTIDNCIIAAMFLETCPDKIHLASGSTQANAKLNVGVCNGFGLEYLFRGRCKWGKFRDNEALFINTQTGEKVVIFAGGGKSDSYKRILGNSYGLWIATEINEHYDCDDSRSSFIKVAFGRQAAAMRQMILWDLNPCNPANPIYTDYIDKYAKGFIGGYQYEHFTIADNLSISPQRFAEIQSQYTIGSVWYRRDILGERCIAEGLIYPMWEKALCDHPESAWEDVCVSIDYGTLNAFAALLWEKHGKVWIATREFYWSGRDKGIQKTDSEYVDELHTWLIDILDRIAGKIECIVDPSAASFITCLQKTGWAKVRPADNDVADGIRETANAMDNGYIMICRNLENYTNEVSGYMWDKKLSEKNGRDCPVKERDHLMDAKRYFVKTKNIVRKAQRRTMNYGY